VTGRGIIVASWVGDALFLVTAVPAALGASSFDEAAVAVTLVLFFLSLVVWAWAFAVAVARSAQGDNIAVANLFGTIGGAPRAVLVHLFGALVVCVLIAAGTAVANPFGVLVPMLPLGFVGLWAARHGTFPPRPVPEARRGQRPA
jgi:hypothetical protein